MFGTSSGVSVVSGYKIFRCMSDNFYFYLFFIIIIISFFVPIQAHYMYLLKNYITDATMYSGLSYLPSYCSINLTAVVLLYLLII